MVRQRSGRKQQHPVSNCYQDIVSLEGTTRQQAQGGGRQEPRHEGVPCTWLVDSNVPGSSLVTSTHKVQRANDLTHSYISFRCLSRPFFCSSHTRVVLNSGRVTCHCHSLGQTMPQMNAGRVNGGCCICPLPRAIELGAEEGGYISERDPLALSLQREHAGSKHGGDIVLRDLFTAPRKE